MGSVIGPPPGDEHPRQVGMFTEEEEKQRLSRKHGRACKKKHQ
ncbi:hypothetical protein B4113_3834 [Geobacillus sp. B4113_201601]|nr:hypothetical protein B4113_3834 [Geobacillus sp. B4113_201601]